MFFSGCPSINSIENGKVIPTSLVVSFTCDDRYHLLGSSSLGCLNGNWNDTAPICSSKVIHVFIVKTKSLDTLSYKLKKIFIFIKHLLHKNYVFCVT